MIYQIPLTILSAVFNKNLKNHLNVIQRQPQDGAMRWWNEFELYWGALAHRRNSCIRQNSHIFQSLLRNCFVVIILISFFRQNWMISKHANFTTKHPAIYSSANQFRTTTMCTCSQVQAKQTNYGISVQNSKDYVLLVFFLLPDMMSSKQLSWACTILMQIFRSLLHATYASI